MVQSSGVQKPSNLWEETDEEDAINSDDGNQAQWAFNQISELDATDV